jgi:tetratricopeptide (TPR) repeat protein
MLRNIVISLALAPVLTMTGTASALTQTCSADPQFAAHRTSNGSVRAQYNALQRGQWSQAIHFGREAIDSGTSTRHRAAAMSNLCAAYAQNGDVALAVTACDAAVEMGDQSWRAHTNRGAALWLAGDQVGAVASFATANALGGDEAEVQANSGLSQCAVVG